MPFSIATGGYLLLAWATYVAPTLALAQAPPLHPKVEFRLAESEPAPGLIEGRVPRNGRKVYMHRGAIITNKDIVEANVREDPYILHAYQITVVFTEEAAKRMSRTTQMHSHGLLVFLMDDKIVSALRITAPFYREAAISGPWTKEQAERLAAELAQKPG